MTSFIEIDPDVLDAFEEDVTGFDKGEGVFIRPKKAFEYGKRYRFRILPVDARIAALYPKVPCAPTKGCFVPEPVFTREGKDGTTSADFRYTSQLTLKKQDGLMEWLKEVLEGRAGYLGGPEDDPLVAIYKDHKTDKTGKYKGSGQVSDKAAKYYKKVLMAEYPDYSEKEVEAWIKTIRPLETTLYKRSFWFHCMPMAMQSEPAVDENGDPIKDENGVQLRRSIPLAKEAKILDAPNSFYRAFYKDAESLYDRHKGYEKDPEGALADGKPIDVMANLIPTENVPAYDIIVKPFENTNGAVKYMDFKITVHAEGKTITDDVVYEREEVPEKSKLAPEEMPFKIHQDLWDMVELGDCTERAIDAWKVKFNMMEPLEYTEKYGEKDETEGDEIENDIEESNDEEPETVKAETPKEKKGKKKKKKKKDVGI